MQLPHSPSSLTSRRNIFQSLFSKVKGAVLALGILSTPAIAKESDIASSGNTIPSLEQRLKFAEEMNQSMLQDNNKLQDTIEKTWSQLKDMPGAPKEILDKYGNITPEGLLWMKSELPEEHLKLVQEYSDTLQKLEKMEKGDPERSVLEFFLKTVFLAIMGIIIYKLGKGDFELGKGDYAEWLFKIQEKIKRMRERIHFGGKDARVGSGPGATPMIEIPEWAQKTFLADASYTEINTHLVTDFSSGSPSPEAQELQKSIEELGITTGNNHDKAGRFSEMSEKFISYARHSRLSEESIEALLRALERSFSGKVFSFKRAPTVGDGFDMYEMDRIGEAKDLGYKITKVLSLAVEYEHRVYKKAKVNC